jgi:hypothetical protein
MSEQRSSSAVRNLRSLFENKGGLESNSPDSRGRSPSGIGSDKENGGRQTSKVRASFVPVEPAAKMAALADNNEGGAPAIRRGSFGEADADQDLKKTISQQQESMTVPEAAVASAAGTPLRKPVDAPSIEQDDSPLGHKTEKAPANPDKPVTAAEEEPSDMKPADPKDESAVSGGEALPPVAEDLRSSLKPTAAGSSVKRTVAMKPTTNGKPAPISTQAASKASGSTVKSPASQPRTPSSTQPSKPAQGLSKKVSRSSLTAPTAASLARSGASDKSGSKTSPTSATKKREVTKPVSLPSHLTAPTASSRAKHDPAHVPAPSTNNLRASTSSRPKPAASTKPAPRASLGPSHRPVSQTSQSSAPRKSLPPADSSFLERMMKPTASSASKTHEKAEAKPAPKSKPPTSKPKVNGVSKAASQPGAVPASVPQPSEDALIEPQPSVQSPEPVVDSVPVDSLIPEESIPEDKPILSESKETAGNATPLANTDDIATDTALEATPAGLGSDELIR